MHLHSLNASKCVQISIMINKTHILAILNIRKKQACKTFKNNNG